MDNNTVLICDDSRSLRMLAKRLLSGHGYDVIGEASSGQEAIEKFKQLQPDLVMLDLVMPQVDGKQALREIIKDSPSAKVVVVSSLGSEQDIEECLLLGASTYIQKPYAEDVLLHALSELR
ncbi:MAG: response regulator [Cellvibrionaceae bacterium]|nr:response regulator [Cellvibrionaceae bacterium]MCV6627767.1 response regulator [Cellvibrionaceae bacterium]